MADISFKLSPKPKGPQLQVSSFEWDADPNTNKVENKTKILIFVNSSLPLQAAPEVQFDPNIMGTQPIGSLAPDPAALVEEAIVAGQVVKQHYETIFFDYAGTGLKKDGIYITAEDAHGPTRLTYSFAIDPNTITEGAAGSQAGHNEGGTSLKIIPAEGGQTNSLGFIDTDNDGLIDDYDGSFIDVPPCAIIGASQGEADPDFDELSNLFISLERITPQGENVFSAQYDLQILDDQGNKATNVRINKDRPLTVYLHFDPAKFSGNLAEVVIRYYDPNSGQWKSNGISNLRIVGNTIAFEVDHLTVFGAFSSKPTNLAAIVNSGKIDLSWQDNSGHETGFAIHRKVDNEEAFTLYQTLDPNTVAYNDVGCLEGKTYYYLVRANTP